MEPSENEPTAQHLWNIGNQLATISPAVSRYYMFNLKRLLISDPSSQQKNIKCHKFCHHCGSLWSPETHRVRIQSKPSINKHIKKLLKWEEEQPWKLNGQQKRKIRTFRKSTSKIIYTCFTCKKTSKFPGFQRKVQEENKRNCLYTLPPNTKRKKSDLNAGLFIATPPSTQMQRVKEKQEQLNSLSENSQVHAHIKLLPTNSLDSDSKKSTELKSETAPLSQPTKTPTNYSAKGRHRTPTSLSNVSSSKKSTDARKRKNTLLAQILKEEEAAKKKRSLSSFLISF